MNKNIFLLWLQGWEKAPWLQQQVLKSWKENNPNWNLELLDSKNLSKYVDDIDYIYDESKQISYQAKSDIIRLSLLKKYGGVWADSTLLCMQPLDHWVFEAVQESGIWMYHGHGANLNSDIGPASWFIISEKNGYLIRKWKESCDYYWSKNDLAHDYFWMDGLFKQLIETKKQFKNKWLKTPFIYCESIGSSHTLAHYNYKMQRNSKNLKEILKSKPPYVIKLSSNWERIFPKLNSIKFKESNAYYAIKMSKRKFVYKHKFDSIKSFKHPLKWRNYFVSFAKKFLKIFLEIFRVNYFFK